MLAKRSPTVANAGEGLLALAKVCQHWPTLFANGGEAFASSGQCRRRFTSISKGLPMMANCSPALARVTCTGKSLSALANIVRQQWPTLTKVC
ncbi:hypothetical protein R1flu_016018 [Riccia fluitans]|uniref:Uncharacterized protein n=1 Tax=Riccia fluitans TaxID=41844 RepID=A0ABD1YNP8_9MARC